MKALIAPAPLLLSVSTYAQGQVNFKTHIPSDTPPIDFKILNLQGTPAEGFYAQLVANGVPMTEPPAVVNAAGYINAGAATFQGLPGGVVASIILRTWQANPGGNYASATVKGETAPFTVTLQEAPNVPGDLLTLGSGALVFLPEPTTLALGAMGLGTVLFRRRK